MTPQPPNHHEWPVASESFGHLLRHHRRQRGLSQNQLALAIGHDYTYISKLETGSHMPVDPDEVLGLVLALGLSSTEADELLRSVPRFAKLRFRTDVAPFAPSEDQKEATWLNMLTALVRVYALERKESAEALAAHLAVFAGIPTLIAFALDPSNEEHESHLMKVLFELGAKDVRTAALMVLRNVVLLPLELDQYQRKKHHLMLSLIVELAELDANRVDLAIRDIYSASLTQTQRNALRLFRAAIEKEAPGRLTIELPSI